MYEICTPVTCAGLPCELERHHADDGEQREEIPEQADDLRVPQAPHHGQPQHVAEGHRDRRRTGGRHGGDENDTSAADAKIPAHAWFQSGSRGLCVCCRSARDLSGRAAPSIRPPPAQRPHRRRHRQSLVQRDVAIGGDTIVRIAPAIEQPAARVIDVGGAVVAPGFIDIHTHARRGLLRRADRAELRAAGRDHRDGRTGRIVAAAARDRFWRSSSASAEVAQHRQSDRAGIDSRRRHRARQPAADAAGNRRRCRRSSSRQ